MHEVLLVSNDSDLIELIRIHLEDLSCRLTIAETGMEGVRLALQREFSLIVLDDFFEEGYNGDNCQRFRLNGIYFPIIILSTKSQLVDKIHGLENGADDYITKPFQIQEFIFRVMAIIRRQQIYSPIASIRSTKIDVQRWFQEMLSDSGGNNKQNFSIGENASMEEKFMYKVIEVIRVNLSNARYNTMDMARDLHLSRVQLYRKIKKITKLSPSQLVSEIRLLKAAELINRKVDTVTRIGFAVGFHEQSYFSKRFKKKFGVSPKNYPEYVKSVRQELGDEWKP